MTSEEALPHLDSAVADLISSYYELNGETIEELDSEPSPLEFMRFVSRNTPFVVRGGASTWKATSEWNKEYLKSALEGQTVNVAVTPHGNADAPTFSPTHEGTIFAKPHEEAQDFSDFIQYIENQETTVTTIKESEVRYAQTQNDNLRDEYQILFPDAPKDIAFARIALQKRPDAVNLWIGNSKSVTAMHKDNFENVFVQIIGQKHFTLLPPVCHACVNEKMLPAATYHRGGPTLSLDLDEGADPVPFPIWDPDEPLKNPTAFSHLAIPLRITLEPGDMLYLPAMWYHKVAQSCTSKQEGDFVVAINYWYDMEFRGPLYPLATFARAVDKFASDL